MFFFFLIALIARWPHLNMPLLCYVLINRECFERLQVKAPVVSNKTRSSPVIVSLLSTSQPCCAQRQYFAPCSYLWLEPGVTSSIGNGTNGTHFMFGSVIGATLLTTPWLTPIKTRAQIALQRLITVADIALCKQFASATVALHLDHLSWAVSANRLFQLFDEASTKAQLRHSLAMYHHHSQGQGPPPFSNAPRPSQLPQNQHQNRAATGMMSQTDFHFPGPTQLPNVLQSALAMRGTRDVDHRPVDNKDMPNQHQGQSSSCGIGQHGSYRSNPVTFTSDNHSGHQQGVDWSSYSSPSKLFVSPPPHSGHVPQKPQSSHTGTRIPNWTGPAAKHLIPRSGGGGGGSGDGQSLYTAESAGSILASFGLSNDDLEVLSHYPDDQLTPDTLPFILRDIQINKSGDQKTTSAPSFPRSIQKLSPPSSSPLAHSQSPELPSLLTVTQTAGKVIDYGHASRAKEESDSRETFKREQLSSERRVKLYPLSSSLPKGDKSERQQVHLKHTNSGKHGDQDYRRIDGDHCKSSRSPGREFPPSSKSRNLDRDYRCDGPKPRPSPKRRNEESLRRSVPSSDSKPHGSSKKFPTPTMIRDFSSVAPKVYPHTCSLCHTQCDQDKVSTNRPLCPFMSGMLSY